MVSTQHSTAKWLFATKQRREGGMGITEKPRKNISHWPIKSVEIINKYHVINFSADRNLKSRDKTLAA